MKVTLEECSETIIDGYTVKWVVDEDTDPDLSYLGEFVSICTEDPWTYVYDTFTGLMWDGICWRNAKGQIQGNRSSHPTTSGRTYRFIDIGRDQFNREDKHSLKYAYQNATILLRYNQGDLYDLVCSVEIWKDSELVASAATCGIRSDSGDDCAQSIYRDLLHETLPIGEIQVDNQSN